MELRKRTCEHLLDEMYACIINETNKQIERTKKHIELGHRGSALEPRDYKKEYELLIKRKDLLHRLYNFLKSKCSDLPT